MWHVKDMRKSNNSLNTEIGNGLIDYKPIFEKAKLAGLKYPIVEQENFEINPFESIIKSALTMIRLSI
jgi:sugar phosphate isomerase/epimerase